MHYPPAPDESSDSHGVAPSKERVLLLDLHWKMHMFEL